MSTQGIDYALAVQLKKAGFPWPNDWNRPFVKNCTHAPGEHTLHCDELYLPTLSELIEACPQFGSLNHWGGTYWQATGGDVGMVGYTSYSTPSEAVAHLWLALNKKI